MDIRSIIHPTPTAVQAKIPTPPLTTRKSNIRKRKRHDPIPIWAVREDTVRDQRRPSPSPRPQPKPQTTPQIQPQALNHNAPHTPQTNGQRQAPQWEPSITNEKPYDEMSRSVCNFIWDTVVGNQLLRQAVAESPNTHVEIEAKWGQIRDRDIGDRLAGAHETECIVRRTELENTKFESTMSLEQHKKMNEFLNRTVSQSRSPQDKSRTPIEYKHIRETDLFYELEQSGFDLLPPSTKRVLAQTTMRHRVRVTRDSKTGQVLRKIIKHRVANLEISSPQTEWDYRISVNVEIDFPAAVDDLTPAVEPGRSLDSLERKKDRMSYTHQSVYQIDLTQVITSGTKNHELELELDADRLLYEADRVQKGEPNLYEEIVGGMMNNLRVLSREIGWSG